MTGERTWLQRLLIWRVWERLLEIEFLDRSIALAGKAFVSFFPMVIVVAAFLPERRRVDPHRAHVPAGPAGRHPGSRPRGVLVVRRAPRTRPAGWALLDVVLRCLVRDGSPAHVPTGVAAAACLGGAEGTSAAPSCLALVLAGMAALGAAGGAADGGLGVGVVALVGFVVTTGVWWFTAWYLLLGDVRARVLLPTGLLTAVTTGLVRRLGDGVDAGVVEENEAQFGFFGIGLSLVTWFSGAAICILVGACIGPVLAEDEAGSAPTSAATTKGPWWRALRRHSPPARELTLRDAFQSTDDS